MVFLAAFCGWLQVGAEQMIPLSVEEMTKGADLVVLGTVESKSCQRDGQGRIYTKVELSPKEVWKGKWDKEALTVVQGGGILGEERVVVSGQVEYGIGEEVVVFLVFNKQKEAVTLGMTQGKFHIWADKPGGVKEAANPFHGRAAGGKRPGITAAAQTGALTLEELKKIVTK